MITSGHAHVFRPLVDFAYVSPVVWVQQWSSLYPALAGYDEQEYRDLICRHRNLNGTDFERIGRWKDNALSDAKWKPNVASVAYNIWMQAALELPREPDPRDLSRFLEDWADRTTDYSYPGGKSVLKCFGLPRASSLLHFISGGKYPIFDSRVKIALKHLLGPVPKTSIPWYVTSLCQLIAEMAESCETSYRTLDQALFCYGAFISKSKSILTNLSGCVFRRCE